MFGGRHFSLAQLDSLADGMAAALQRRGVRSGERVALMSSNRPEFVVAVQAIWRLGAAVVLLSPAWKRHEVVHALAVTSPAHAVGDHPVLAELMPMLHLDEPIPAADGSRRGSAVTLINPAYTSQQVHPCGHLGIRRGKNVYCQTAGCPQQGVVYDTEINAARVIRDRATDPRISRYTPTHEVKRILMNGRAGTVENCPTTTQATTLNGDGCERNNLPPKQSTTPKK